MDNNRRNSKKRQAIYSYMTASDEHPSAEQIYSALKPEYPDLSLGTVYRNIGVLIDDGLIFSVGKVNGEERFDAHMNPHAHFICSGCGKVVDIVSDSIPSPDYGEIESRMGISITSHKLCFTGLCDECSKK